MTQSFSHTLRALDADRPLTLWLSPLLLAAFGGLFGAWFFGARVTVFASVDNARIEASEAGHKLQAQVSGYVVAVHEQLDRPLARGDTLVEIDASSELRELEQKLVQQRAARAQLVSLKQELSALERVRTSQRAVSQSRDVEAAIRQAQAADTATAKARELAREQQLLALGAVAPVLADRSLSEAERERHEADASAAARSRIDADQRLAEAEQARKSAQLQRELAQLEGNLAGLAVRVLELEREIDKRRVRSPITGRLGTVASVTVGSFVHAGDELGTVIPNGSLRIVALFPADQALGRIQPGQAGNMRLTAFPWTQFGSVRGVVERVGREVRDGGVRVELRLVENNPRVSLQHGLPGKLEIEVERTSPARLAFRAAGGGIHGTVREP